VRIQERKKLKRRLKIRRLKKKVKIQER